MSPARQKLHISGTDGLMLVVFHPDPASADADKLALQDVSDTSGWTIFRSQTARRVS